MGWTEHDEATIVRVIGSLMESVTRLSPELIRKVTGKRKDFDDLTVDEKMAVTENILDDFSDEKLRSSIRKIILDHIRETYTMTQ